MPSKALSAKAQLNKFLSKFNPEIAKLAKAALVKMRKRLPGAIELVYDNYNALAIGFCPSERASEGIFSIALFPRSVILCFLQNGPRLHDPKKILRGSGNVVRNIVLESPATLDDPAVQAIMAHALKLAKVPIDSSKPNRLIIKSISAKQRPRRPA